MPDQKRLLELALKGLETERQRINEKSPSFSSNFILEKARRSSQDRPSQQEPEVDSHLPAKEIIGLNEASAGREKETKIESG